MINFFRRIFGRSTTNAVDEERLRAEFQSRYHHFRQLLRHDREAHECMMDIEEALRGEALFDMPFVRQLATRATESTSRIVADLMSLAPGRYDNLQTRFQTIQANISPHIEPRQPPKTGPLTVNLAEISRELADFVGPKMAYLGEAGAMPGIDIPQGFVISAESYRRFMSHRGLKQEIRQRIRTANLNGAKENEEVLFQLASSLQQLIIESPLPDDVAAAIMDGMDSLDDGQRLRVAMRSSGLGEDLAEAAFAGQYKTKLNVSRDEALLVYKVVVASKYGRQAMSYRWRKGIRDEDAAMCVGVMRMVDATAGGVAYSSGAMDPLDLNVSVHSTWGLPKTVVDGSADADLFRFDRCNPPTMLDRTIAHKDTLFACRPDEGTCSQEVESSRCDKPSLTNSKAKAIAALALRLDEHFGSPQDIEWALDAKGNIILLQTRTLLRPLAPIQDLWQAAEQDDAAPLGHVLLSGGNTASPGSTCGKVFRARSQADLLLFPEGDILLIRQALPSWAPLMHRARGVISEMGSAAGHLANVAREFDVPALFGLKGAYGSLEPGATITLDANTRKVYQGRIEGLHGCGPRSAETIRNSPVHASLRGAARHILPLHLLDPDSPEFRPRNCESLHDLVRFCHEKSVREMFSFGQDRQSPRTSAKQLYHDGAKQFWVLNLDDGYLKDEDERFIRLENIASIPMLALWEGINAVPWEGPPPVNARGLLSVMFEATANPALEPALASHYAQRNYFMVTRNFVSLQSRFGFHFCGVEALVGEQESDNYAEFQFQGGAAGRRRRILRTKLIADLLQERDFRVKLRGDALSARMEGFDRASMVRRLRALGYLIIHTRQLDMIMADPAEAQRRRKMLSGQLDKFFLD
ncbi:PEP/pyruvate-binding domain-containing protein [Desulfovibrio ferrophilus]|uniref:Phosphoenolpyruvate synthase n=1 Tax=Desulfovibrio ferrophilus TaxID=241368 RepID=A0A2Z6B0U2_9BACT|nr:PEP/pyruvate-binding domain-containing protein [Desulfovibrio ferrophilus]BBD09075.1 pyruvate, water dikinase [Desulfovibrio ferrophilus]